MASGTVDDVGNAIDGDEVELIDIGLEWNAPAAVAVGAEPTVGRPSWRRWLRHDPRWLIMLAVVAYVGWFVTSGGSDDEQASEPAPTSLPVTTAPPVVAETSAFDEARAALAGDPTLDLAGAIDALTPADYDASYLEMQVNPSGVDVFAVIKDFDTVPGGFRFAYIGVDGEPIVVDTGSGVLRSVVNEMPLGAGQELALLPDGDGVIGLSAVRPDGVFRVATDVAAVRRADGDLLGVRVSAAGLEYGLMDDLSSWETLPAGADLWIEPSVGAFVSPDSGGVFELTPDGVQPVTPFEMVATNGTRWIELRRVVGPNEYWVVDRSGEEWLIDREQIDVEGDLSLSPDGAWIFAAGGLVDDAFPAFWGVETGEIIQIESRADRLTPVWAPDSSFVAELDPTRNCIWINFISGLNGCIVLDQLNVPALEASALVIY